MLQAAHDAEATTHRPRDTVQERAGVAVEGPHGEDKDTVQHVKRKVFGGKGQFTVTRAHEYTRSNPAGYNKQQRCYYLTMVKGTCEGMQ